MLAVKKAINDEYQRRAQAANAPAAPEPPQNQRQQPSTRQGANQRGGDRGGGPGRGQSSQAPPQTSLMAPPPATGPQIQNTQPTQDLVRQGVPQNTLPHQPTPPVNPGNSAPRMDPPNRKYPGKLPFKSPDHRRILNEIDVLKRLGYKNFRHMSLSKLPLNNDENLFLCYHVYDSMRACPHKVCIFSHNLSQDVLDWLIIRREWSYDLANNLIQCLHSHMPHDTKPENRLHLYQHAPTVVPKGDMSEDAVEGFPRRSRQAADSNTRRRKAPHDDDGPSNESVKKPKPSEPTAPSATTTTPASTADTTSAPTAYIKAEPIPETAVGICGEADGVDTAASMEKL